MDWRVVLELLVWALGFGGMIGMERQGQVELRRNLETAKTDLRADINGIVLLLQKAADSVVLLKVSVEHLDTWTEAHDQLDNERFKGLQDALDRHGQAIGELQVVAAKLS